MCLYEKCSSRVFILWTIVSNKVIFYYVKISLNINANFLRIRDAPNPFFFSQFQFLTWNWMDSKSRKWIWNCSLETEKNPNRIEFSVFILHPFFHSIFNLCDCGISCRYWFGKIINALLRWWLYTYYVKFVVFGNITMFSFAQIECFSHIESKRLFFHFFSMFWIESFCGGYQHVMYPNSMCY